MNTYTQLTREERYQIHALKQTGHSQTEIAVMLGRHKSTISRELSRNQGMRGYRPKQAHSLALERRKSKARPRFGGSVWVKVELLIRLDWSPEQISGRLKLEEGIRISHEHAMERLNHRPRKTLGFQTPFEVFFSTKTPLTVALGS